MRIKDGQIHRVMEFKRLLLLATNPKPKLKAEDIFSDDEEDTKMEDNALKTKSNEQPKEEEEEEEAAVEEPVTGA